MTSVETFKLDEWPADTTPHLGTGYHFPTNQEELSKERSGPERQKIYNKLNTHQIKYLLEKLKQKIQRQNITQISVGEIFTKYFYGGYRSLNDIIRDIINTDNVDLEITRLNERNLLNGGSRKSKRRRVKSKRRRHRKSTRRHRRKY